MKSRAFLCFGCLALIAVACAFQAKVKPMAPEPDTRLKLSTPRRDYLLGEPVLLDLKFRNDSKESIKVVEVVIEPGHYEAPVWIAPDGDRFEEFRPNVSDYKRSRQVFTLRMGDALEYQYRVIGASRTGFQMPFAKPGAYRIYVVFPLYVAGTPGTVEIPSNLVEVRVKQPAGDDAKVWDQLKDPAFLTLLQYENVDDKRKDVPLKLIELLRSYPNSGYAPALRMALSRIYFHKRSGLPQQDQHKLAQALGITMIEGVADPRLDARRKEPFEKDVPLSKLLASLSQLGVTLDALPELKEQKVNISEAYTTLRGSMAALGDKLEATWEKRGDAYFLVPFQAPPAKQREDKGKKGP